MKDLYVRVAFASGNQLYTYRTPIVLSPKDTVVIPTPRGYDLAKVHSMEDNPKLDVPYEYKWIVQKVDFTEYRNNSSIITGKSRL